MDNWYQDFQKPLNYSEYAQARPLVMEVPYSTPPAVETAQTTKQPVKLSWRDLTYEVQMPDGFRKRVLNNCTGYAGPGVTTYIMGASGAGKTTLLNALSDRISTGRNAWLSGMIRVNDEIPMSSELFGKISSYIMQDDYIFE